MKFLSVCSGIEAASVAWHPLGWRAAAFAEIEPFPCAVLAHHYPDVPNRGDMTRFKDWPDATVDLLCGGTPCQSFSNAGMRAGLDDPRGQLMLTFGAIAARYRPRWLVWENVPGVLSSGGGRDFGAFVGLLGFLGYGFAYRVLDAQFVRVDGYGRAVPQRRNRVFVVGCLGDWRSAAAVLLERESLCGDPAPRREPRSRVAGAITRSLGGGRAGGPRGADDNAAQAAHLVAYGGNNTAGPIEVGTALTAHGGAGRMDFESETFIAFNARQDPINGPINGPIDTDGATSAVLHAAAVRRLMPVECERLQGFPDGYTAVPFRGKPAADGPRYKALGNSWAVNCARWIGRRIAFVDTLPRPDVPRETPAAERLTSPCN